MPLTAYTYSIANDFPGSSVELTKFDAEIRASAIVTALSRIDTNGDVLEIYFVDALSAGEKTILDGDTTNPAGGLIAAHDNTLPTFRKSEDQAVSNTTSLTSDTQLKFLIIPQEKLDFKFVVFFNLAGTASGIKLAVNGPAAMTYFRAAITIFNSNSGSLVSAALKTTTDDALSVVLPNIGDHYAVIEGCFENGVNPGYVGLRFAQHQSDNNAVTIKKGSLVNVANELGDISAPAISGRSGYSGISGFSGLSGVSGFSGTSAYSGFSGFSGIPGSAAAIGDSGYSGVSGFSGGGGTINLTEILARFWMRL